MTDRGQGVINVMIFLVVSILALWVLFIVLSGFLEPLYSFVDGFDQVHDEGYGTALDRLWTMLAVWAPTVFGVGVVVLGIIFAVWREQFQARRQP